MVYVCKLHFFTNISCFILDIVRQLHTCIATDLTFFYCSRISDVRFGLSAPNACKGKL